MYKIRYIPSIKPSITNKEVQFIAKFLPKKRYKTILDFMCGFGRHSIALGKLGYCVKGFDIDEQSIIQAIKKAKKLSLHNVKFEIGDAVAFSKKENFDATICIYSAIGAFDQKSNKTLFRNLLYSTKPGGRLILDVLNPEWAIKHICAYKRKEVIFQKKKYYIKHFRKILSKPLREYNILKMIYPIKKTMTYSLQLYSLKQIKRMLKVHHFKLFDCFGFFNGESISSDTQRMIIIADRL